MIKTIISCIVSILPLAAITQSVDSVDYRIFDTHRQQEISLQVLADSLMDTDVLFFGEEHNDSVAHFIQHQLFKTMYESYPGAVALSLEMFASDDQLVLDEYLAGLISEQNLSKDATLWKNYKDYRPLVEYAKENNLRVLAANAPSRYTNRVTRGGLESLEILSEQAKALLAPLPIDTLTGAYYEKFAGLMGGHDGMGHLKIYQSQNLWDATMAYRLSQLNKDMPMVKILHLNGRFHSDEKLGTVAQLKKYSPYLTIKNIACFPHDSFTQANWDEFVHLGDYIILTDPSTAKSF